MAYAREQKLMAPFTLFLRTWHSERSSYRHKCCTQVLFTLPTRFIIKAYICHIHQRKLIEIIREIQIKNHSKENVDFWQNKERKKVNKVNVYIGVKPNPLDSTESR